MDTTRIAFLHLAPAVGQIASNRELIERAIFTAAQAGASWILTPELCVCGYAFPEVIGTEWILPQPDPWMERICTLAASLHVTLFLSHPERDDHTGKLHNTVFAITPTGDIVGKHRKINVIPISEAWSTSGETATPIPVPPVRVGVLICADAYSMRHSQNLKAQGAELLVSAAAWAPGEHGPSGEWEQCTRETGLPLLVCNRTGKDRTLDFTRAISGVFKDGECLLAFQSEHSMIFLIDWDWRTQSLALTEYNTIEL